VLAARYAADLTLGEQTSQSPTFALMSHASHPVVATSPAPDLVVLHHLDDVDVVIMPWVGLQDALEETRLTGLAAARPARLALRSPGQQVTADPARTLASWDLLVGAALVGIAERAVEVTQAYVVERKQFGVPIGSFAGLRAVVAEMALRVEPVRAQLDQALVSAAPTDSVAALAGRAAVDNCLDGIQAHGGYGYIAEYPMADLLRDAVSLQARSGGRRLHVARVAGRGLGDAVGPRP
jgi:alkylation response protein AidB-like acyl-CoA dehydrogenase